MRNVPVQLILPGFRKPTKVRAVRIPNTNTIIYWTVRCTCFPIEWAHFYTGEHGKAMDFAHKHVRHMHSWPREVKDEAA